MTIAKDLLRCDGLIKMNNVVQNRDNGILCAGLNNFCRIEKNPAIASNRLAGIKAIEGAQISIVGNSIFGNFCQGILLTETTSAHVEQNDIYTNFKANIALGGINSGDTVLLRNRIGESRSEGIFILEGGYTWIHANEVTGNNDGIVMYDSGPLLLANDIVENQRTGVICTGCSFPKIERNLIAHNLTAGILVKGEAVTKSINNKVRVVAF